MKNILIVDGAINCAYDIFSVSENDFNEIFMQKGQNIEFVEDVEKNSNSDRMKNVLMKMWSNPVKKEKANGIHGILFYQLEAKKQFYLNKMDEDLDFKGRNFSVKNL